MSTMSGVGVIRDMINNAPKLEHNTLYTVQHTPKVTQGTFQKIDGTVMQWKAAGKAIAYCQDIMDLAIFLGVHLGSEDLTQEEVEAFKADIVIKTITRTEYGRISNRMAFD